jgi:hypothetical protein
MIAVVCHDAGGAEIISSWIRSNPHAYCLVLGGPAIDIFRRKFGNIELSSLDEAIKNCDWVLCGTSWQSDLEKYAIQKSKLIGKKVIAFLDHWIDYPARFIFNNRNIFPDEIWVSDLDAFNLAKHHFSDVCIKLTNNPYFDDLLVEMENYKSLKTPSRGKSVLYVCEPLREHAQVKYGDPFYWGYTEDEALKFFLKNISALGVFVDDIRIRPHPSEMVDKYQWAVDLNPLVSETFSSKSLISQIIESDIVVGVQSMAMVVALLAKKRVITSVPLGGKKCELPQVEIESLQDLVITHQGGIDG